MYSSKQRHAVWQKYLYKGLLLPLFIFGAFLAIIVLQSSTTSAAPADTLNFQGRLRTDTGALVSDGSYNIEFKIYDSAAAGASAAGVCSLNSSIDDCWWLETRTVTVQNGYFSVYLGDITPFGANVPWDQELWLTMNVNSDGEMSPRFRLTAVPYAFRAGALVTGSGAVKTADDFAQLSPSALQTLNTTVAALRLNQTGTGALLELRGDGVNAFTVDKTGNAILGAGITLGNSSSTVAGTIRWNGTAFQGYNGTSWTSLGSSAVMPFVSKTKTINEIQNSTLNPTAVLQPDDELFFSIGVNETWNYRFIVQASVNATPDIKFSVTAPVGAVCVNSVTDLENAVSVANLGCGVSSGNLPALTAADTYEVVGSITNGATAGVVTLNWAQNTANAANVTVLAGSSIEASRSVGGSSVDVAFVQNGNSFGGLAVLGTNDANGLSFETNGIERVQILSSGEIRARDDLIANRTATGSTGTTSGTGTNTTTLVLTADNFNLNDVIFIDNTTQDYYTRITNDPGTGTYTVSPAITYQNARTVTGYSMQNIGATTTDYASQANRFFQGYFTGGVVVGAGSTTISDGNIESTTDLTLQGSGGVVNIGGGLVVAGAISGDGSGLVNIDGSSVDGATLTSLNASNIASGTLTDARLSSNVVLLSTAQTFTGLKDFSAGLTVSAGNLDVTGDIEASGTISGATIVGNGAGLTDLSADNIVSGTLADARLSANVTLQGNTFNGVNQLVQLSGTGALPAVSGAALTNLSAANLSGTLPAISGASLTSLNATNISSGTVTDARLSTNVTLLGNTFNGVSQLVQLSGTGALPALNGAALTGLSSGNLVGALPALNGSALTNLSAANLSGALPALSGANLTGLNGSSISSGTVNDARLSANVVLLNGGQTFSALTTFGAGLSVTGDINATGAINGLTLSGNGSAITALNGSNITTGTVSDARLSANVTLLGNTFNGINQLVRLNGSGALPALDGSGLTNLSAANLTGALPAISGASLTSLNATNISSGTLTDGRLSANVALLNGGQTFSALTSFGAGLSATGGISATGSISGATIVGDGSGLSNIDAADVAAGTLADSRLSANVAFLSGSQTFTGSKTFSGGLVLGQSTLSSLATVARAVSLPDEAGTICLSNTNTCGFLRIAAGVLQTDASNNDVLAVNKTSATGNLITLQRSGGAVFTVANSGALQIQSTSSSALDIRNAGGTAYFTVDSSTGVVRVGSLTLDATGVVFALDSKSTVGDPTGVEGGMYFNDNQKQYRCFRSGSWENCSTNAIERGWEMSDEFMSGYTGGACTTATAIIGDQNWTCFVNGTATIAYNNQTAAIQPSADRPGILRMTTAAANGNGFTMTLTGNNSGSVNMAAGNRVKAAVGQGVTITNNRLRVGLHAQTTLNTQPVTGVWWEADATTNANWRYCYGTGAAPVCASSGVAIAASTMYSLDIQIISMGTGTSSAVFTINGTSFTVSAVTFGTARVNPAIACFNSIAGARECFVDYYQFSGVSAARR